MKLGFTTRKQAEVHAVEASIICHREEIKKTAIGRQVDVDHLLGFSRPTQNVEQLLQVQSIVTYLREG
jgi:hypothetical protein